MNYKRRIIMSEISRNNGASKVRNVNYNQLITEDAYNKSRQTALLAIFGANISVFAILAWIVPFGHITMDLLINVFIIMFLRLKKKLGACVLLGIIVGIIDTSSGLGGPGFFLAPIVYAFRFGFLEYTVHYTNPNKQKVAMVVFNAIGYFLTTTLIWALYYALGIPLGTEFVSRMWFVFGFVGALFAIPTTILAFKLSEKVLRFVSVEDQS